MAHKDMIKVSIRIDNFVYIIKISLKSNKLTPKIKYRFGHLAINSILSIQTNSNKCPLKLSQQILYSMLEQRFNFVHHQFDLYSYLYLKPSMLLFSNIVPLSTLMATIFSNNIRTPSKIISCSLVDVRRMERIRR